MTKIQPFRLFVFLLQKHILRRKRQCYQDTDLGDTYSKFAAHGCPEARQKQILEFLRACYNNKDYAHVLHQLLFFPEQPG